MNGDVSTFTGRCTCPASSEKDCVFADGTHCKDFTKPRWALGERLKDRFIEGGKVCLHSSWLLLAETKLRHRLADDEEARLLQFAR